jgi:hypothetical protein
VGDEDQLSDEVKRQLVGHFPVIKAWRTRTGAASSGPVEGSPLRRDDEITHPYQISHAVIGALVSAVDHMDALRTLVEEAHVVHARAPYTLLRGALENAAVAVWLLAPANRIERVTRRLRWHWVSEKYGVETAELIGARQGLTLDERKTKIETVARSCGMTEDQVREATTSASFRLIVKSAGDEGRGLDGKTVKLCWMAESGIAHAQSWAVIALLKRVEVRAASEGIVGLQMSASDNFLLLSWAVAARMISEGWRLLDERSKNHLG